MVIIVRTCGSRNHVLNETFSILSHSTIVNLLQQGVSESIFYSNLVGLWGTGVRADLCKKVKSDI